VASVIYYAVSHVGDYAKDERAMPFEALVGEQVDILNGVNPHHSDSQEGSTVDISIETKV
jgi:hypothetical protein